MRKHGVIKSGLQTKSAPVHNIKPVDRAKGVGPARGSGGPGFARSLPTHVRVRSGATTHAT